MSNDSLLENLYNLIEPIIKNLEYEFYHLELIKEDGEDFLRVYIDNENGISLSDCEKVSRQISTMLDEQDPIPFGYYLEVSSPGVYRTLFNDNHLNKAIGEFVLVKLNSLFNGNRELKGILSTFNDVQVTIRNKEIDITIPKDKINNISLTDEEEGGNKKNEPGVY